MITIMYNLLVFPIIITLILIFLYYENYILAVPPCTQCYFYKLVTIVNNNREPLIHHGEKVTAEMCFLYGRNGANFISFNRSSFGNCGKRGKFFKKS